MLKLCSSFSFPCVVHPYGTFAMSKTLKHQEQISKNGPAQNSQATSIRRREQAVIPYICHFFYTGKILVNKIYTEKRQFFALFL